MRFWPCPICKTRRLKASLPPASPLPQSWRRAKKEGLTVDRKVKIGNNVEKVKICDNVQKVKIGDSVQNKNANVRFAL